MKIPNSQGTTYITVLWRELIHVGLAWMGGDPGTLVKLKGRAPPWSRASVDGYFTHHEYIRLTEETLGVEIIDDLDLENLNISVDEIHPDLFGDVRGGSIEAVAIPQATRNRLWTPDEP